MSKKVILSVLVLSMLFCGSAFAQKLTYIKIGNLNPKATDSGLILSLETAKEFDDRVELGVSMDLFMKDYTDETTVWETNPADPNAPPIATVATNFESSVLMIPLMGNVLVRFPVEFPIIPYASGGIGYTLLWYKFDNYLTDDSESQFFGGFTYRLGVGGMYPLGAQSAFIGEIFLNGSKPSHKEETEVGLPTRNEINMSGLGFRFGIRLGGFGFF